MKMHIIMLLIFSLSSPSYADTVLLRSGGIMQGEVLDETDTAVKFRNASGVTEKIKKGLVASIVRKEDESAPGPEEIYARKVKEISPNSAQEHYKLGMFCLENSMVDHAAVEFSRAVDIDPSYEKPVAGHLAYINKVRKEAARIINMDYGDNSAPSMGIAEMKKEFANGGIVKPANKKDSELIAGIIAGLGAAEEKEACARKYIELGDGYADRAQIGRFEDDEFGYFRIAPLCYDLASRFAQSPETRLSAEKRINEYRSRSQQMKKAGFLVPSNNIEKDAILLFIKSIEDAEDRKSYYGICFYMGDEYKSKVRNLSVPLVSGDRRNLEVALNCYEIAGRAYSAKDIIVAGLVKAKIQDCREWLRKDDEAAVARGEGYSAK
ncbi:MAG: hypothetical protein PHE80_05175 [Candidatus Omnitrophica bacterium]|nr:hypothetical protein [Candidatus Omnitrophota bacterium]MDD5737318.1 hypothetical protein [Candidatus Omnitrophota bacterium]